MALGRPSPVAVVVAFAALVLLASAIILGRAELRAASTSPSHGTIAQPAPTVVQGSGVTHGHAWLIRGWRLAGLRCMALHIRGGASQMTCFRGAEPAQHLGLNYFGGGTRFVFGQAGQAVARVRVRLRYHSRVLGTTEVPIREAARLGGVRYYVATVPPHLSLDRVDGLDAAGRVLATAYPGPH